MLNLSFNQIGPRGAEQLANALQENKVIRFIILSLTHFFIQTLVTLDLQFNEVGDTGKWRVRRILEKNSALKLLL